MEIHPIAVGVIIAAGITGFISLLSLIISKEQKTSEFRQQWIDSLRNEIAEMIGYLEGGIQHVRIIQMDMEPDPEGKRKVSPIFEKIKTEVIECEKYYPKILLRVNPDEHKELIDLIDKLRKTFNSASIPSPEQLHEIEMELIQTTQGVLKSEWIRVKKGELTFRIAKYSALVVLGLSLIVGGYVAFSNPSTPSGSNNQIQVTPKRGASN